MTDTLDLYTLDTVVQELKDIAGDTGIPQVYRDWARDGIAYAGRNNPGVYVFPQNIFSYCTVKEPMPERVRELVEGILLQEIRHGNSSAANDLGELYYDGRIGEQSYRKAMDYYMFSADRGNEDAYVNLGYCYYYGRDGEPDYDKAYDCFIRGALTGDIRSLYKIGDMYRYGLHVQRDERQARNIYSHCVDMINQAPKPEHDRLHDECGADVYIRYGECFLFGIGGRTDAWIALSWAQRAEQGFRKKALDGDPFAKEGIRRAVNVISMCRNELDRLTDDSSVLS